MKTPQLSNQSRRSGRQGVAAVEFAICLPVMVLLTLALIETCTMTFLKQSCTVAAYEGAHTGLLPAATAAEIRATCEGILNDRRVNNFDITVIPNNLSRLDEGEFFEVRVTAPTDSNGVLPGRFFRGRVMTGSAVMMKEI